MAMHSFAFSPLSTRDYNRLHTDNDERMSRAVKILSVVQEFEGIGEGVEEIVDYDDVEGSRNASFVKNNTTAFICT